MISVDLPVVCAGDQLGHRVGRHRSREVKALHPPAPESFQVCELVIDNSKPAQPFIFVIASPE